MSRSQKATAIFSKYSIEVQASVRKIFELRLLLNKPVTEELLQDSLVITFIYSSAIKSDFWKEKYNLLEELLTLFF